MRHALLVSAALLLAACPDPAKDKPKAVVTAPAPAPKAEVAVAPLEGAVAYPFTQESSKLAFTGAKLTGKHEGGFGTFGGIIEVVGGDATNMGSVVSDAEKLTGHLKSPDFFDVAQFPQAKFVSTGIKANEGGDFTVTGELTLHGVTKGISFPAKITLTADEVTVAAEFAINRKDFGIVYPGKPDDLIADNVALKLDLHAKKKAP
ncbi:MAG: YceI family protein [Myxococcota bacterium]